MRPLLSPDEKQSRHFEMLRWRDQIRGREGPYRQEAGAIGRRDRPGADV